MGHPLVKVFDIFFSDNPEGLNPDQFAEDMAKLHETARKNRESYRQRMSKNFNAAHDIYEYAFVYVFQFTNVQYGGLRGSCVGTKDKCV